mmetsp:Transcript_20019/g.28172  ORF Transcript_20019/g.28172 Transcript_20019/m.28172 type:complete len:112 (-) Transcript_20019:2919-3254(-)
MEKNDEIQCLYFALLIHKYWNTEHYMWNLASYGDFFPSISSIYNFFHSIIFSNPVLYLCVLHFFSHKYYCIHNALSFSRQQLLITDTFRIYDILPVIKVYQINMSLSSFQQ